MTDEKEQPKPEKRRRGRPSKYSDAVVDRICTRLVEGESLRRICSDPDMPSLTTIWNWYRREDIKEDFLKQFLRARAFQSLVMDGDMQDIADDSSRDITEGEDGEEVVDREHIQRSKLRVDTLWRRMKCMNPEMFAEKLDVNHGGKVEMSLPELFAAAARERLGDGEKA
ncbi:MAG: hypothetical protein LUG50_08300 [Planctomycetaceae bacterium]|nr:hypothetical protein [Planctomycetaceae bacterium]